MSEDGVINCAAWYAPQGSAGSPEAGRGGSSAGKEEHEPASRPGGEAPAPGGVAWTFPVVGMSCASCVARVEKALAAVPGVTAVSVNLAAGEAAVQALPGTDPVAVAAAVRAAGYDVPAERVSFGISGMSCASCVARVEGALAAVPGVVRVSVNLAAGEAAVELLPGVATPEALREAVARAGYAAVPEAGAGEDPLARQKRIQREEERSLVRRLRVGALCGLPLVLLAHWEMAAGPGGVPLSALAKALVQLALASPVQFYSGARFYRGAFAAARHRTADMNTLVALGTTAAYLYGAATVLAFLLFGGGRGGPGPLYFDTSAAVIVLVLLGRWLEARAKGKTSEAVEKLLGLQPKTARAIRDGIEREIPLDRVAAGDRLVVRPGEKIPVDGVVIEGGAAVDEAMLTGEAVPADKVPGDSVTGGTIDLDGRLVILATRVGRDTAVARIVEAVRRAQGAKPPIGRLADAVAARFVPAVIAAAALAFAAWMVFGPAPRLPFALVSAMSVLVVACPCAMGLATPTSIMVGTGRAAQLGLLIRNGAALEMAEKVDVVVFDKTGTLTRGKPELAFVRALPGGPCGGQGGGEDLLRLAASAERGSAHPLAGALVRAAQGRGLALAEPSSFHAVPGRGIRAVVEGRLVRVGNRRWLEEEGVDAAPLLGEAQEAAQAGATAVLLAVDDRPAGIAAFADEPREEAAEAVRALAAAGLETAMLTGDDRFAAEAVARRLGIARVVAGILPEQKAEEIRRIRGEGNVVAMVGDGINDAPALAAADLGIALGTGADVAVEAGDVVIMSGDPRGVAAVLALGRATLRNIRQNLFWAFAYNVLLIPVAAGALYPFFGLRLDPVLAAAAMGLSSVTVVTNALRLRRFRP